MFDPLVILIGSVLFGMWFIATFKDVFMWRLSVWWGYTWYTPKPQIIGDTKVKIYPRVRTHKAVLAEIEHLKHLLAEKDRQIADLAAKRKVMNSNQMSFLPTVSNSTNGHKITLSWPVYNYDTGNLDTYLLVFKDQLERARFTSENDMWVEREIRNVGKDRRTIYKRMWVNCERWNNTEEKQNYLPQNGNEFDPETDVDILKYFPYQDKAQRRIIPDEFLPFTWNIEKSITPFSIAQHELLFKDK